MNTYHSSSETETNSVAEAFVQQISEDVSNSKIVLLKGDLGAGKTAFCRAFIRCLCGDPALEVPSPTFTLVQTYEADNDEIWHFDLYRIEDYEEIYELGWEEACDGGLVLVEWPERLGPLKPHRYWDVDIKISADDKEERDICIAYKGKR